MSVLIIAEPGMTWDRKLDDAYRLIDAAKACGADVCKFQWTSSGRKIQQRRNVDPKYIAIYEHGVQYPREWLEKLKGHCDRVGIEFACTTYLPQDIEVVAPLVKRFKISAYEAQWCDEIKNHEPYGKEIICSHTESVPNFKHPLVKWLHCVSEYPTPIERLELSRHLSSWTLNDGLSDHTANVLTGAAAVAAGARIVEAHIKLNTTPKDNPDFAHSLYVQDDICGPGEFWLYVNNIRTVERML